MRVGVGGKMRRKEQRNSLQRNVSAITRYKLRSFRGSAEAAKGEFEANRREFVVIIYK